MDGTYSFSNDLWIERNERWGKSWVDFIQMRRKLIRWREGRPHCETCAVRICYSFFFSPYFLSPDFHRAEKQRQWSIVDAIGKPSLENWGSFLGVLYRMQMICVMLTAHPENRLVHLRSWIQNTRNFPHINIDRRSFWTQISNSELVPQVGYVHHKVTKLASIVRPVGFS